MTDARTLPAGLIDPEDFALPLSFEEVTPALLSRLLQRAAPGVVVKKLSFSHVSEGTGSRARITLDYQPGTEGDLPRTMWLKSWFNELRSLHLQVNSIIGEIAFYRLASQLSVRAPKSYYAGIDASGQGLVLMEDLIAAKATFPGVEPLNLMQVRDALEQLARLHGAYWGLPAPEEDANWPMVPIGGALGRFMMNDVIPALPEIVRQEHLAGRLPPELTQGDIFGRAMVNLFTMTSEPPYCLIHFDPHLGNLAVNGDKTILLDWQFFRVGRWSHDVSYLIGSSLRREDRRQWERGLLDYYLERLEVHGGVSPSFEEAWRGYAAGQLYGVFAWVNTHLDMQSLDTIYTLLSRHLDAMSDLGTLEVLS